MSRCDLVIEMPGLVPGDVSVDDAEPAGLIQRTYSKLNSNRLIRSSLHTAVHSSFPRCNCLYLIHDEHH